MGFRDMECFNLALLAKQAWRVFLHPDLLLSRILKAKYFPRTSFLLAEVGERPSQTWRSILAAKPFMEMGLRRRIGNGQTSSTWGDDWLVSEGSGKVLTRRSPYSTFPNTVSDLINWSNGEWDLESIREHLWDYDISRILQVPLGSPTTEDGYYWFFSPHGRFTVRSCYYQILAQATHMESLSSGTSLTLSPKEWQWIWGLQLPPKIRTFLWRACNEIIPVRANLVKRRIGGDPVLSALRKTYRDDGAFIF